MFDNVHERYAHFATNGRILFQLHVYMHNYVWIIIVSGHNVYYYVVVCYMYMVYVLRCVSIVCAHICVYVCVHVSTLTG